MSVKSFMNISMLFDSCLLQSATVSIAVYWPVGWLAAYRVIQVGHDFKVTTLTNLLITHTVITCRPLVNTRCVTWNKSCTVLFSRNSLKSDCMSQDILFLSRFKFPQASLGCK